MRKKFDKNFSEILRSERCKKHVNLVDLVKSFPTNIFLQDLPSIQKSTSPVKFAHLAEKSEKRSTSNLSTKGKTAAKRPASSRSPSVRVTRRNGRSPPSRSMAPRSAGVPSAQPRSFSPGKTRRSAARSGRSHVTCKDTIE